METEFNEILLCFEPKQDNVLFFNSFFYAHFFPIFDAERISGGVLAFLVPVTPTKAKF